MLSECFSGTTFQVLHQSKQTFQGASQRTWVRLPGLLSAHAQGHRVFLTRRSPMLAPTLSTTTVQKTGVPFVPPKMRQKNRLIHRQLEGNNLRPRHPQYCFRLQNSVALQTSSLYHSSYKSQPSKCRSHRFRGEDPPHQGGYCRKPPIREGFSSRLFLVPKKSGTFRPVIDLSFLNKFMENSHSFQMKSIHCLKSLLQKGDYMTTLDLKEAYLSVPSTRTLKFLQFLWRNKCYTFQGLSLFWLKYCTKDLHQNFKTHSNISSQTGCPYDPLSGRLSNLGVALPGGSESHSHGCIPPGKPRLHCQSGKVMFDSDPNNNIPGLCNRLYCRCTKPPTGESCEGEIPLLEGKSNSNYACSSNSKCTRHSRVVSPSNLVSSPSFSILVKL